MSILVALAAADDRTWRREAACRGKDPRIFFEPAGEPVARRLCGSCPVKSDCLDEALADTRDGFWGGLNDQQRVLEAERRAREAERQQRAARRPVRRPPRARGEHYEILLALTDHPHRWARVDHYPNPNSGGALASLFRNGHRATPPGRWSFEGRVNDDGSSDLYARYDGPSGHGEVAS